MKGSKMTFKSTLLLGLLLASQVSFASTQIDKFGNANSASSDFFIRGEFSADLNKANASDVRPGKFFVRLKSQDAFDDTKSSYNLFSGIPANEAPKLVKFDLPAGMSLSNLLMKKLYTTNNPATEEIDVEKIYTDGTSIYTEYGDALFYKEGKQFIRIARSASLNTLTPPTLAADANQAVQNSVESQSKADAAADDIDNRFGYGSEIRTWSGWGLVALGAGIVGGAYYYHTLSTADQKSIDNTNRYINTGATSDGGDPVITDPNNADFDQLAFDSWKAKLPGAKAQLTHNQNLQSDHNLMRNALGVLGLGSIGTGIWMISF